MPESAPARKPRQRQIDAARRTLEQVFQWAEIDEIQRDGVCATMGILDGIDHGTIKRRRSSLDA